MTVVQDVTPAAETSVMNAAYALLTHDRASVLSVHLVQPLVVLKVLQQRRQLKLQLRVTRMVQTFQNSGVHGTD